MKSPDNPGRRKLSHPEGKSSLRLLQAVSASSDGKGEVHQGSVDE